MSEIRCWLVERDYWDKDLVTLVYATPDGTHHLTRQWSTTMLSQKPATAAIEIPEEDLEPVDDPADRERYAREAARLAEGHDPDDHV